MADEGNLDALCWSADEGDVDSDGVALEDSHPFERPSPGDDEEAFDESDEDRRRSPRVPTSDFVDFVRGASDDRSSGWLIDASAEGLAFITETKDVPTVGTSILPTIRQRGGGATDLGDATVVRTELLNDTLSLVCAQLMHAWDPYP